ncbi:unnamed protein product, partial [Prorocentrum cordatum]
GSPKDYFRYTPKGAAALAEHAGLEVVKLYAPGDLALVSGTMQGMVWSSSLWPSWSSWPSPRHDAAILVRPARAHGGGPASWRRFSKPPAERFCAAAQGFG